jgi:hypothetical protein
VRPLAVCLLLCLLHGIPASASAQSANMPGWVVPVLRLVSATHVEPTTGVVLSADGLVLVPADFAAPGDEIIVLDGGTDIIRNGRPARLEKSFPDFGLEVLRVEGLRRNAAPVAPDALKDGSRITLRAFPPAELIADGAPPVNAAAAISVFPESDIPALAAGNSLPNVTGALLDECGNLAGLSLADGVQSLDPAPATRYRWGFALRAVLADLQLPVSGRSCAILADADLSPAPLEEQFPQPEVTEPAAAEAEESTEEPPGDEAAELEPLLDVLPPFEKDTMADEALPAPAAQEVSAPLWPWLAGGLLLLAGGVFVHRLRRGGTAQRPPTIDSVAEDPAPALADPGNGRDQPAPMAGPTVRLVLRGELADGRVFEAATEVSAEAINLEIGRGDVDLVIASQAVSRRHARLNGSSDSLTLTDLGSSNGTAISGVPCLEGEIMYLEAGDTVILGDARFNVAVEATSTGGPTA